MATEIMLRRSLLARFPWIESIELEASPYVHTLHVALAASAPEPKTAVAQITVALEDIRELGMEYGVSIGTRPPVPADGALEGPTRLASIAANPTHDGLLQGIIRLVPAVAKLVMENRGGGLLFFVSGDGGTTSAAL